MLIALLVSLTEKLTSIGKMNHFWHGLIFLSCLSLVGCGSYAPKLGISKLEWSSLSKTRQKALLGSYAAILKQRSKPSHSRHGSPSKGNKIPPAVKPVLKLRLSGGKAFFPPDFLYPETYQPVAVAISPEEYCEIPLVSKNRPQVIGRLGVILKDNVLYLDPSHYDLNSAWGTVKFLSHPLWQEGFTYANISSTGYTQLRDVTVHLEWQL